MSRSVWRSSLDRRSRSISRGVCVLRTVNSMFGCGRPSLGHASGASWTDIGEALGVTKQAAWALQNQDVREMLDAARQRSGLLTNKPNGSRMRSPPPTTARYGPQRARGPNGLPAGTQKCTCGCLSLPRRRLSGDRRLHTDPGSYRDGSAFYVGGLLRREAFVSVPTSCARRAERGRTGRDVGRHGGVPPPSRARWVLRWFLVLARSLGQVRRDGRTTGEHVPQLGCELGDASSEMWGST
jgi:hypothetical protein